MEENIERTFDFIAKHEGCKVHKVSGDSGGLTSAYGLTLRTMKALNLDLDDDGDVDADDVNLVNAEVAMQAFKEHYWDAIDGDNLPSGLDLMYADVAWNSGVGRARQFINEGYETTEALLARRLKYYRSIVAKRPSQRKFLNGWENRANDSYEEAQDCV